MDYERIALHALWKTLDRHIAKREARRYIAGHFRPSLKRHNRSVYSLKHDFERAAGRYINEDDYAESLRRCGLKVVEGKVFAKEPIM